MGALEEGGKALGGVVESMKGTPMILALLLINVAFLGVLVYLIGAAVTNSNARHQSQLDLIEKLVTDMRECRQGSKSYYNPMTKSLIRLK